MPRKLLKKYMPDQKSLQSQRSLRWLGKHLADPNLWHLTRKSVSKAFMVGIFAALLPVPFQMVIAAILALRMKSNLAISIGLVWLTNPLTMPPVFYCTYRIGAWILGSHIDMGDFHWDVATLQTDIAAIWWPLLLGSVVSGVVASAIAYFAVNGFWIWHVNRSWRRRQQARRKHTCTTSIKPGQQHQTK